MARSIAVVGFVLIIYWFCQKPVVYPTVHIPEEPVQEAMKEDKAWEWNDHHFKALATYRLKALILATEDYSFDRASKISPVDFALGWGPMADKKNLKFLDFSQYGRWYHYTWKDTPPIPEEQMKGHSANTHMIARDENILDKLHAFKLGHVIEAEGYLVEVSSADGFTWKSSLTRTDRQGGACEVFWVEKLRRVHVPSK